ncbi:helix-turn-helix domain-containing protein [Desulfomicrobium baculatum]|uniref:Uncharacterized protein n=1 Tax=Desulfomicrobium baculatum (strain DSM 4028 / VKM B-1378 / X) TaxID=525897 RepID=C7LPF8_DESBD|nr:helix-turn-helix domain-containing protein [Desulfomicrobium baculatum]ACU89001.1 hypothetical protein Dbac_0883 [Desulfomicrobium baculatum DSM 4028]
MKRIICHGDIAASVSNGGFVRFPKYLMLNTYDRLPGLDNATWQAMSLASKSVFPVMLYFKYISEEFKIAIPSQDTLCKLSGIGSRNTIMKACNELCNLGICNRLRYMANNGHMAHGYDISLELEMHAEKRFMPLPKYVIKNGLWAKLGGTRVAQALYWAMRSFVGQSSDAEVLVCNANRKELCERAGISVTSFYAAEAALVDFGFVLPG